MPRKLIAVVTCDQRSYPQHDQGGHENGSGRSDAIRATWYKSWLCRHADQIDLKFFFGQCSRSPQDNEIVLDCGDDYYSLPAKVRKTYEWAYRAGYDEVTKIDDDCFLWIDRLLARPLETDYRGYEIESDIKYASGTCYQLSRRAMELVSRASVPEGEWREDRHIGRVLLSNGIRVTNDERFLCCSCDVCIQRCGLDNLVSLHTTNPKQLYDLYNSQPYNL